MNAEKKTALVDLIESSGFSVLMEVIEELVRLEQNKLLKYDLRNGAPHELTYLKCESDGARRLANSINLYMKNLKAHL